MAIEVKEHLSELEAALKDVDSERDRELGAVHLKYKSRAEALEQAINSVAIALGDVEKPETIMNSINEDEESSLSGVMPDTAEHLNGVRADQDSSDDRSGTGMKRFSARREIENLLPALGPERDIKQGEIRYELEERFPEHKDSLKAASIASALRRLVDAGKLVLVSKGSGSEPNIYRLSKHISKGNGQEELGELKEWKL